MDSLFLSLLILMVVIWTAATILRLIGLPTIMGELLMGVILGPAVLGWVEPNEIIHVLAQLGMFFLMLHAGVNTKPQDFFSALRVSLGVALIGALVPFAISATVATAFGIELVSALFVGLTMTATAVVITLKILRDLELENTRIARVIIASCVIDDLISLIMFSLVMGLIREGEVDPVGLLWIAVKAAAFFISVIAIGRWMYPLFKHPFRNRQGKGFTFVLVLGLCFGLFADLIGLHIIVGAYMAGLFFREEVASTELLQKVEDRLNGIAYSFLGPIFFISLGFHVTFDALAGSGVWFLIVLTLSVTIGQIVSAGIMARRLDFTWIESLTVGVGMCGRGEVAFVLASLGLSLGAINEQTFSILVFTTFVLNIITPVGLKMCSRMLEPSMRAASGPMAM
jgi:Kef-type K+ transport system membrane component KefB